MYGLCELRGKEASVYACVWTMSVTCSSRMVAQVVETSEQTENQLEILEAVQKNDRVQ